jgi:hypothetical protein
MGGLSLEPQILACSGLLYPSEDYPQEWADGELPAGYATEDGTALHYAGTELREALAIWPGRRAWHVAPDGADGYTETPIEARPWTPPRE